MNIQGTPMDKELKRSLNLIIIDITLGMAFITATSGVIFTGFARMLGASDLIFGIMMAMPVIGGILQIFASYTIENTGKRKLMLLVFGIIHRSLWIFVALIPLLISPSYQTARILAVTIVITLSSSAGSFVSIAYLSWVGDLVPPDIKGRFFSKRTAISTIVAVVTGLLASRFLDQVKNITSFAILFILASILGVASILCYMGVKDPPFKIPEERIPFHTLITKPFHDRNYIKYIAFVMMWNFGMNFADPFYNLYMLEHLKMSYFTISLFSQIISNIMTILFIGLWGKVSDAHGSKPVIAICCTVISTLPLLWLFATPDQYLIILLINILGGLFVSGYNVNAVNMSIWLAPKENRSIYIAVYNLIVTVTGTALAYVCGGAFLQYVKPILTSVSIPFLLGQNLNGFHALFITATLLRLTALTFFLPQVKEENSHSVKTVLSSIKNSVAKKLSAYPTE